MRLNVQYIPLRKIKPDLSIKITERMKKLRNIMWDCMHILVVKKNKDGNYTIISGKERLEYLQKHTKNKCAPCIVDESHISTEVKYWFFRLFHMQNLENSKSSVSTKISPKSLSIIRSFIKEEPRFKTLSTAQKIKVIYLAIRYKKTVILCMKLMVDELKRKK